MPYAGTMTSGTTFAAYASPGALSVSLASGSNIVPGSLLWADGELMQVQSITAPYGATTPSVLRAQQGTRNLGHLAGAPVGVYLGGLGPSSNLVPLISFANQSTAKQVWAGDGNLGRYIIPTFGPLIAFAAAGTSQVVVPGTTYIIDLVNPFTHPVTGVQILTGAASGAGNGLVTLYDREGFLIASSASTATSAVANAFSKIPFTAPVILPGPQQYFVGYQGSNATDTIRVLPAANALFELTTSVTGTFGSTPNITPPTTFTTLVGPLATLY